MKKSGLTGSERDQLERLLKETKSLKQKVDQLEKENRLLKKSIYELSSRYAADQPHQHPVRPFDLSNLDEGKVPREVRDETIDAVSGSRYIVEAFGSNSTQRNRDGKQFHLRYDLKGHAGAIYCTQFSRCGRYLATGSFDKTVRVWDAMVTQKELVCLKGHNLNISDLSWSNDSTLLLSGAYDQTCKMWNIETEKLVYNFHSEGFVQCVMFDPQDNQIFYNGTSRNVLALCDIRKPGEAMVKRNDSMINSLYVCRDGIHVITGDATGYIKTWDMRIGNCVQTFQNESSKKPISHIAVCQRTDDVYEEPRYMAVNSYDNVIRVYDRGLEPPKTPLRVVQALKGYKNKNWPIKSSFYYGKEYEATRWSTTRDEDGELSISGDVNANDRPLEASMLLATGSADPYAYIYNVGVSEGNAEQIQRLEGHTDRVYAVSFHPMEPIIATCSADFTVKVWAPNGRIKKKA
ncbi:uncharacterized protein VTP21DRAFT_3001 [Calcarisporiella thermophila]|uniref:uncharacterized protein n=1 Tax=Calcarisporiella thermophila TaxID=911321 RepID=UPI0037424A53